MASNCPDRLAPCRYFPLSYAQVDSRWKFMIPDRPLPPVIDAGTPSTQDSPGRPPSDAWCYSSGKDLSMGAQGRQRGEMEVRTAISKWCQRRDTFTRATLLAIASCTWNLPSPPRPKARARTAETAASFCKASTRLKFWTPYQSKTYADGQAAAIYGQYPPLVNASRPPGQWQTYDNRLSWTRFAKDGKLLRPPAKTFFHDGVLVQDNVELSGRRLTANGRPMNLNQKKLPLALQDHNHPVRYPQHLDPGTEDRRVMWPFFPARNVQDHSNGAKPALLAAHTKFVASGRIIRRDRPRGIYDHRRTSLEKLRDLPPEKQKEVLDFVDFLKEKNGTKKAPS